MLFQWVWNYFASQTSDNFPKCPIYCQHSGVNFNLLKLMPTGHSRTIIGAEKTSTGDITLLILDPSRTTSQINRALGNEDKKPQNTVDMRCFRRTIPSFHSKQYQLVAIFGVMTPTEQRASKSLASYRIPDD